MLRLIAPLQEELLERTKQRYLDGVREVGGGGQKLKGYMVRIVVYLFFLLAPSFRKSTLSKERILGGDYHKDCRGGCMLSAAGAIRL